MLLRHDSRCRHRMIAGKGPAHVAQHLLRDLSVSAEELWEGLRQKAEDIHHMCCRSGKPRRAWKQLDIC